MNRDDIIAIGKLAGFSDPESITSSQDRRCVPDLAAFAEIVLERGSNYSREDIVAIAKVSGFPDPERIISSPTRICLPDLAVFAALIIERINSAQ